MSSDTRTAFIGLRTHVCTLCLVVFLALAAASAPSVLAASVEGGNSFNELTKSGAESTQTQTTATSSTEPSNSKSTILLAIVAAGVVLSGIAFVIVRDARRVAPADDEQMIRSSSANDAAVAMRKRRAKAKAARKQRKRNR